MPDVAVPDPDVDWAVVGPCQPWVSAQAVWECCGSPMMTIGSGSSETECAVDMTPFAVQASQILYELSGRQFAGACSKTVRPACDDCYCGWQILSRGHIIGPWDYGYPYNDYCFQCLVSCQPSRINLSGIVARTLRAEVSRSPPG